MIQKILIGFALATLSILLLFWLATGGIGKVVDTAGGIGNFFRSGDIFSGEGFRLPWQPTDLVLGPDITEVLPSMGETPSSGESLAEAEEEYEGLLKKIEEAKTFGDPSPYRGKVVLSQGSATESTPDTEYLMLEASWDNTAPISLGGWSLQSALTGLRGYIQRAAHPFLMGAVNSQSDIYLDPGASATVSSGVSPVGTSFRENLCTGYLAGLQAFEPPLERSCPSPSDSLSLTPENLRTYGEACYDFVQTVPSCTFPREVPSNISPECHLFLANNLSYNGCVQNHRHRSDFARDSWRLYLNAYGELWRNSHDIIRLLDAEGRTVDYISY